MQWAGMPLRQKGEVESKWPRERMAKTRITVDEWRHGVRHMNHTLFYLHSVPTPPR